jgi:AGCS family alanine or glycine:cation symporter
MAHAAADVDLPARQGLFGVAEVFVDTVLLCTVTALCILVSDSGPTAFGADVTRTAQAAFSSVLGEWAAGFFALSILLFGAATVLCWGHYGMTCVAYLTRGRASRPLRVLYVLLLSASLIGGSLTAPAIAWEVADRVIALMTVLNLVLLAIMSGEVKEETERLPRDKRGE